MPGPPAPFVPAPLPNIAKSGLSPKDFSTSVKIEGNTVAIRGATFESIGDMASKGTGGGLISANTHGPAKFITPGSLTVKIEGKSVHLLGEPMLNNCGPSGSPPNTGATMAGLGQDDNPAEPCPPHDIKYEDLTPEAEKKRRERTEATKNGHRERMNKNLYDSKKSFEAGDNAMGNALLNDAIDAEGQMNDVQFEQDVAKQAKAKWTGVKYWCTKCNFKGEIDAFTEKNIVKESKRNGHAVQDQCTRHLIAAPEIFGAVAGFHLAVPSAKISSAQYSLSSRGLDNQFDIQPH
jgi:uncharacterized Zn-binding protein involved in type VI secretion